MKLARTFLILLLPAIAFFPLLAYAQEPPPLSGLDLYIEQAMHQWHDPGLAIAVVKDGKVVLAKGFGVREVGKPAKVDKHTLFAIASNTKAFTTVSLGMLIDAGKLTWDSRLTDYLKGFQMYDPFVTREVTVRDALTHRSGDCGADFLWYNSPNTRVEILHKMRLVKPRHSFRAHYCYSNDMVMAAGMIVPAVTGTRWNDFVENRIFKPLGMTDSNTSITEFEQGGDIATPHAKIDGHMQPIRWLNWDNIGPAASINSSVADLSHWLEMLLGDGEYDGRRIVGAAIVHEMETPQIIIPPDHKFLHQLNPEAHTLAYGLTLRMDDYHGEHIVWHTGHLDGMSSALGMIPDRHLGVVILTNQDESYLPVAILNRVFDAYLGVPPQDWSSEILALQQKFAAKAEKKAAKLLAARSAHLHPSVALNEYVGTYTSPLRGTVNITLQDHHLVLESGRHSFADLVPWNHDTFRVVWRYHFWGKGYVQFGLNPRGAVDNIRFVHGGRYERQEEQNEEAPED
ncbi:MAG TPA: serine hydrolase [Gammaproteobacteria bacterium]|nr:serine hydrolase [Gammaproteobacteria bacterium]